ncbi:MAG: elongation factor P [Candidatus Hydrogenedentes bacterium CG07_land_8_20_14_0_80_42_17]|nr:MAG: elongation factor P [Candidatus Hydrogenedentes bacterium CG07_land_8_20_14_0_80_42_17]
MITMNQFRKGMCLKIDGKLMKIVEFQHVNPGNWRAFVRTKLKDLSTGNVVERTYRENDQFEEAMLETAEMQLLYSDVNGYNFMNQATYEQVTLSKEDLGNAVNYLKENDVIKVEFSEGKALGAELPASVALKVIEAPPATKGNTATGATKPVKLETGLIVNAPLFIIQGEMVKIDTRTGAFLSRA